MTASRLLVFALLAALLPLRADAQANGHTLAPGDTVRVLAPAWGPRLIEGELLVYHTDSLAVRESATGTRYAVALEGVQELFKNEGTNHRRWVRRGAAAGLFLGVATGVVSGPLISMRRKDERFGRTTLITSLGGGLLGAGLGALAGTALARDHWQPFRMPIVPPDPASGGVTISITLPAP